MAVMADWQDYQEQAAEFFRSFGLEATTDEKLSGARGSHRVDVAVRAKRFGIEQIWVVECKHWRGRVTQLHVSALRDIVHEVGADRGILLSESGFQKGAISLAERSNITLTSLAKLRESFGPEDLSVHALIDLVLGAFQRSREAGGLAGQIYKGPIYKA